MDKYNTLPPHIKPEGSHLRYHCSNGRSFIFDRCDLSFFVGTMCTVDERGYVTANRKKDLISHILLGVGRDSVVDHINGDPFDNRRSNLRVATIFQNHWNYKISERNSTGFKGIYPDKKTEGFEKIQTNFKVVGEFENSTLVEVELVTGKTHQIRAHFSHIGHFVVGDEKYGDSKVNKLFGRKNQCLCAYKIKFHFKEGALSYLDGKEIVLDKSKIDFCQNL